VRRVRAPALCVLVAAAVGVAAGAAGCRKGSFAGAPVVLISIDTLRADRLSAYGGTTVDTPAIDALAKDGIVYETVISHVPLTLPSHATLFTGRLPFENGVRDNLGYRLGASVTLASELKARGYATGGAVSSVVLDHTTGISQGFDSWDDAVEVRKAGQSLGQVQRPGMETEAILESWIEKVPEKSPLFAFLHVYEPHTPYEPPEPFASRYAGRLYDGEVAAADAVVGRLVAFLKQRGLYDRALLVLVSDHGEGLGDHGEDEHGIFLYREELAVPLIVKLPGGRDAGRRVSAPAGLVDVLPTVLSALGAPATAGARLSGAALWPEPPAGRRIYSETMFPRFHFGWSDLASLADGSSHYIHAPRAELYDWKADPGEKHDLAAGLPAAFRSLRAALTAMSRPLEMPGASDPETVKKLASLGYIGAARPDPGGPLPDPKDRIGVVAKLREADRLANAGEPERGIALLESVVRENPQMLDARETLSRALRAAGRREAAYRELQAVDRLQPGTPQILLGLAGLAVETGALEDARKYARAAEAAGSPDAAAVFASIALAAGNLPEARTWADAAARARPKSRAAWLMRARIEAQAGDYRAVLSSLDAMEALSGAPANASSASSSVEDAAYLRGDALARLGRPAEARAAFERETREFPDNPKGWAGLALLEASEGRPELAARALATLTSRARTADAWFVAARTYDVLGDRASGARARAEAARRFPGP
jgi:tetratricopeptide (TPR) repeat protein